MFFKFRLLRPVLFLFLSFQEISLTQALTDMNSNVSVTSESTSDVATTIEQPEREADRNRGPYRRAQARLRQDLLQQDVVKENISPMSRTDEGIPVKITLKGTFQVITVHIDDAKQMMTSGLILSLGWQDDALAWNSSHYDDVHRLELPTHMVWTPYVYFANSMHTSDLLLSHAHSVSISNSGAVSTRFTFFTEASCIINLAAFPYDEQDCVLIFHSNPVARWEMKEERHYGQLVSYLSEGSEWNVVNITMKMKPGSLGKTVPEVVMTLRRRTMFYTVCLVLPMVLTSYMNTLVFLLPPQSGEKVSFLVSLFVSTSVFISFVSTVMPRTLDSVMPTSMKLLVGVIVQSLLSLLATILVLRHHHREQETGHILQPDTVTAGMSDCSCIKQRHVQQKGRNTPVRVIPGQNDTTDESTCIHDRRTSCGFVTAHQLDCAFFALAFVGNTTFLAVLYATSWN